MNRLLNTVYIQLGSNVGDRKMHIKNAIQKTRENIGPVVQRSSMYESQPWGIADQATFINAVIAIECTLQPRDLLSKLKEIETALGRTTGSRWGPREIDMDIILWGQSVYFDRGLYIPHQYMAKRRFVMIPLAELIPGMVHPLIGKTIQAMLEECPDELWVKKADQG